MKAQITKRLANLPAKIEDIQRFILVGKAKVKANMAAIKAIKKGDIQVAAAAVTAALEDTQDLAEELLYAEAKMGGMLAAGPNRYKVSSRGGTEFLPPGITKKDSHYAQQLSRNEEVIAEVAAKAREAKEIPLRSKVLREIERRRQSEKVVIPPLKGFYRTIVVDPPWPMEKIERHCAPNQARNLDYPVMTLEQISGLKIPSDPVGAHLLLWTTHRFLPDSFGILEGWGFKYVFTMVWHKPGGFQPFNLPQYNCEFVLYGRRGEVAFQDTKDFFCCFSASRTGHSSKPEEFYKTIVRTCPEPRIDMFARRAIPGFEAWGNEIE